MRTHRTHIQFLKLGLALSLAVARLGHAEEAPPVVQLPTTISGSQDLIEQQIRANQIQQQKQQDRNEGNGAAIAMAIVGAVMAGLSCAMLMKAAQEEQDPAKKKELMAQALQQCAQAAQNAASAAQNKKQKDMLTFNDTPKSSQAQAAAVTPDKVAVPTPDPIPELIPETPEEPQVVEAEKAKEPEPQVFDQISLAKAPKPEETTTELSPIGDQLGFNDNAPVSAVNASKPNASAMSSGFFGSGGGAAPTTPASAVDSALALKRKTSSGHSDDNSSFGGADSGGRSDSESGSGSDVSGMLSKLMGGKDGGETVMGGANAGEIAVARNVKGGKGGKLPNIFEYTSYRIRETRKKGDLKGGRLALPPAAAKVAAVKR